ncbi:MAG: hypothetical protein RL226_1002 [Bacteroidota bacterium]|jgi:hypothetical protein
MNKLFILIVSMVVMGNAVAQDTIPAPIAPAAPDTTKIKMGSLKVIIVDEGDSQQDTTSFEDELEEPEKPSYNGHWDGVDLGINILLSPNNSTDLGPNNEWLDLDYSRSLNWSLNLFEKYFPIVNDNVGIVTGLGVNYKSFGLKNNVAVQNVSDSTFAVTIPDSLYTFSKNKLRATYLQVPLLIELNTNQKDDKSFHFAFGVTGGLRIGSIVKQEYEMDGQKVRTRVKNDYNFNDFQLDGTVRIGHGNLTLWVNYGLLPLFEKDKGPEVMAMSAGITLIPF